MTYDPFARGDAPVGVMSREIHGSARDRTLPVEIWYPTTEAQRGRDVDAATQDQYDPVPAKPSWGVPLVPQAAVRDAPLRDSGGRLPGVLFSHGFGAHRRQSTDFCTHLASHGYVVASLDHIGNTFMDLMDFSSMPPVFAPVSLAVMKQLAADRPADMSLLLDELLAGQLGIAAGRLDPQRVGMTGHSFGGWTTLVTTTRDSRIVAALPLAPGGGRTDEANPINDALADEPALKVEGGSVELRDPSKKPGARIFEVPEGEAFGGLERTISLEMCGQYFHGNASYHTDKAASEELGFRDVVVGGRMTMAYAAHILEERFGDAWFAGGRFDLKFTNPTWAGDTVVARGVVTGPDEEEPDWESGQQLRAPSPRLAGRKRAQREISRGYSYPCHTDRASRRAR